MCTWENGFKGISLFGLAPTDGCGDGVSARAEMMAYESTVGNHTPADAKRMAAIAAAQVQIPADRLRVRSWIDHAEIWVTIQFGMDCTLLPALREIAEYLGDTTRFSHYTAVTYRTLIWTIHRAIRAYFHTAKPGSIEFIAYMLGNGMPVPAVGTPSEVQGYQPVGGASGGGSRVPYTEETRKRGAPPGIHPDQEPTRRNQQGPDCLRLFAADIDRARAACSPGALKGAQLARDSTAVRALFGPEFCALLTGHQNTPCLRHFVIGNCTLGNCGHGHNLSTKPSQSVFNGVRTRVKAACDKVVRNPNA
jgi:hypothetical protein